MFSGSSVAWEDSVRAICSNVEDVDMMDPSLILQIHGQVVGLVELCSVGSGFVGSSRAFWPIFLHKMHCTFYRDKLINVLG